MTQSTAQSQQATHSLLAVWHTQSPFCQIYLSSFLCVSHILFIFIRIIKNVNDKQSGEWRKFHRLLCAHVQPKFVTVQILH